MTEIPILRGPVLQEALHSLGIYSAMGYDQVVSYAPLLAAIRANARLTKTVIGSVIDVGCGVGVGVSALWSLKFRASGVDVSPSAIDYARQRYVDPTDKLSNRCVLHRCFLVGNVKRLPFPSLAADAILSAGLLEHVDPKETHLAIAELARVARQFLFIQVASTAVLPSMLQQRIAKRGNTTAAKAIIQAYRARAPHPVEVNLKPQAFWVAAFEKHGYILERNIALPSWQCCSFVLRRNASAPRTRMPLQAVSASPGVRQSKLLRG